MLAIDKTRLLRRLRHGFELLRPLPHPNYIPKTPKVGGTSQLDPYFPPNAPTLAAAALSFETGDFVSSVLQKLTPCDETILQPLHYHWGRAKFGSHWRYADITTVLCAAALLVRPRTYLEIGVRRGRSAAIVAATCPECQIYGFDLWRSDYGGSANPGPDFVRSELQKAGHGGELVLISGDSKKTVPKFLREHPDLFFDLITVDGDHSAAGAAADLANTLPRMKVGGVLVFDDLCSAPVLMHVWRKMIKRDSRYATWEFLDSGYGVGAAIRISDKPALADL